jgi:probable O-glycosylation ligase (exosortase A-associated)
VSAAARGARAPAQALPSAAVSAVPGVAVALTLLFTLVEYMRPQDWIGPLRTLPVGTAAAIPLLGCLALWARPGRLREPELLLLGAITAFCAAWVPFAVNGFHAFETFKFLALELLAAVAIVAFLDSPARLGGLLLLLFAGFLAQGLYALASGGRGFTAHFGDENDLALGMNVALPFVVFGAFAARALWLRVSLFAASGVFVAAVVASASRGGLVTLAATSAAMFALARRRLATGLALAAGIALLAGLAPDAYWADMRTMFDRGDSTRAERIRHWEQAQVMWRDNPIFGVAPGNLPWVASRYETYDTTLTHSLAGRVAHSLYFTVLAEFGLVGVALYGGLALLLARRCLRLARAAPGDPRVQAFARAIACSLAAWLVGGLFLSVLYYPHLYFLTAIALSLSRQAAGAPAVAPEPRRPWATPLSVAPS